MGEENGVVAMSGNLFRRTVLALCLIAVGAAALTACGATPTATPPAAAMATPTPASVFAMGYTILSGDPAVMAEAAVGLAKAKGVQLQMVEALPLGDVQTCAAVTLCLRSGAEIRLYRMTGSTGVLVETEERTADAMNWLYGAYQKAGKCLYVDAVYRTGSPPPQLLGGDPWIAGGSPWIAGGSGGGVAVATSASLWSQWGLRSAALVGSSSVGISLTNASGVRLPAAQGAEVRVGVFDTSPFAVTTTVTWIDPRLLLQVMALPPLQDYTPLPTPATSTLPDVRDHGLYVAGLVHAVAPASDIHLYPVLDNHAMGDLWTLARSIHDFTAGVKADRQIITGAVMNLSLGLRPLASKAGVPADMTALKTLVSAAHCQGIVVVAAAGNDSAGGPARVPQLPASLPEAIAVGASDMAGGRACYSNQGEIMAPGGEASDGCSGSFGAPSMVGLVRQSQEAQSGFAYWAGTSFAAPLVSGLARLSPSGSTASTRRSGRRSR